MLQQYCDIMQVQIAATTKAKNKMQKRDKKEKKNINHSTILKTSIILYLMQHLLVVATLLQHSHTCASSFCGIPTTSAFYENSSFCDKSYYLVSTQFFRNRMKAMANQW